MGTALSALAIGGVTLFAMRSGPAREVGVRPSANPTPTVTATIPDPRCVRAGNQLGRLGARLYATINNMGARMQPVNTERRVDALRDASAARAVIASDFRVLDVPEVFRRERDRVASALDEAARAITLYTEGEVRGNRTRFEQGGQAYRAVFSLLDLVVDDAPKAIPVQRFGAYGGTINTGRC